MKPDAFERPDGSDKFADGNAKRLCQSIESPGPRYERSPFDFSQHYERESDLRDEVAWSQLSGQSRPGDVRGDTGPVFHVLNPDYREGSVKSYRFSSSLRFFFQ